MLDIIVDLRIASKSEENVEKVLEILKKYANDSKLGNLEVKKKDRQWDRWLFKRSYETDGSEDITEAIKRTRIIIRKIKVAIYTETGLTNAAIMTPYFGGLLYY